MKRHHSQPRQDPGRGSVADSAVRRAIAYLAAHQDQRVTLNTLARHTGMSATHLQRTFTRIVGMSPKLYGDSLRLGLLKGPVPEMTLLADQIPDFEPDSSGCTERSH